MSKVEIQTLLVNVVMMAVEEFVALLGQAMVVTPTALHLPVMATLENVLPKQLARVVCLITYLWALLNLVIHA